MYTNNYHVFHKFSEKTIDLFAKPFGWSAIALNWCEHEAKTWGNIASTMIQGCIDILNRIFLKHLETTPYKYIRFRTKFRITESRWLMKRFYTKNSSSHAYAKNSSSYDFKDLK